MRIAATVRAFQVLQTIARCQLVTVTPRGETSAGNPGTISR